MPCPIPSTSPLPPSPSTTLFRSEPHLSPQEWRAFVEYIAAPFVPGTDSAASKPWAYKRYAQGQAKPWAEEFERSEEHTSELQSPCNLVCRLLHEQTKWPPRGMAA